MNKILTILLLLALAACSQDASKTADHTIGRDPTWFPLQVGEKGVNVTAFSTALVQEISRLERTPLHLVDIDWAQLLPSLEKGEVGGVLTSISPSLLSEEKYAFSDLLLPLGPVLILPATSSATSLGDLHEKVVAVYQYDASVMVAQLYPSLVIKLYENMPTALEELSQGSVDAVLMPSMQAKTLVPHLYPTTLKIASTPLTNQGLRLVTLKDQNKSLLTHFNKGLQKARAKGTYTTLLQTYDLN